MVDRNSAKSQRLPTLLESQLLYRPVELVRQNGHLSFRFRSLITIRESLGPFTSLGAKCESQSLTNPQPVRIANLCFSEVAKHP